MKKSLQISLNILLLVVSGCKPIGELVSDVLAPSGAISISAGAAYTVSAAVTLTFDSSDSTEMYVTNTAGCESGGVWEAYATTKSWTLGQTNAMATVYVKFKDRSQNVSSCYSDAIVHDSGPAITSLSPNAGNPSGGISTTISGSNFQPGVVVTFGSQTASCTLGALVGGVASQITCTVPAGSLGAAVVTVTNPSSLSATSTYTYQPAPTLTSISPNAGALAGGTSVTLTGTGFLTGLTVTVGGTACTSPSRVSATQATCVLPAKAAGSYDVVLTNTDAQFATLTSAYTYQPAPTLTSISPNAGALAGGTSVTLTGTGFKSGLSISVGGTACSNSTFNTSESATCTTPAKAPGTYDVVITNSDNQSATLTNAYTYQPAPTLTSFTPGNGPLAGGTTVILTGTGFMDGMSITVGGTSCTTSTFVSSTTATCVTPAKAAGYYVINLINPDGQETFPPGSGIGVGDAFRVHSCLTLCGGTGNGCYDNNTAITATCATVENGNQTSTLPTIIQYTKADPTCSSSCFYVWKYEQNNRILNSTGLWAPPGATSGWQKKLNPDGIGENGELASSSDIAQIAGRVCPYLTSGSGVFINYANMVQTGRCLYYDSGNAAQALDKDYSTASGTEGIDWMRNWDTDTKGNDALGTLRGRGSASSYFEGNIKTCADKGMRLPTLYEISATSNDYGGTLHQPTGDGLYPRHPSFAGANGVPSHSYSTWTASAGTFGTSFYWLWSGTSNNFISYSDSQAVRCVLP